MVFRRTQNRDEIEGGKLKMDFRFTTEEASPRK